MTPSIDCYRVGQYPAEDSGCTLWLEFSILVHPALRARGPWTSEPSCTPLWLWQKVTPQRPLCLRVLCKKRALYSTNRCLNRKPCQVVTYALGYLYTGDLEGCSLAGIQAGESCIRLLVKRATRDGVGVAGSWGNSYMFISLSLSLCPPSPSFCFLPYMSMCVCRKKRKYYTK